MESDGVEFMETWRNWMRQGGLFGGRLTDEEVEEAVLEVQAGGPLDGWNVLVCPSCGERA